MHVFKCLIEEKLFSLADWLLAFEHKFSHCANVAEHVFMFLGIPCIAVLVHSFINVTFHASFPLNQVPRFCSSANNCKEYSQKAATCTLLHFSILDSLPFRISVVVHKLQKAASAPASDVLFMQSCTL